jgi:hypothetical protein
MLTETLHLERIGARCTLRRQPPRALREELADNVYVAHAGYESQNTRSPELAFRALLESDGARAVRFERVLRA